jgi:hypothetical protein
MRDLANSSPLRACGVNDLEFLGRTAGKGFEEITAKLSFFSSS